MTVSHESKQFEICSLLDTFKSKVLIT